MSDRACILDQLTFLSAPIALLSRWSTASSPGTVVALPVQSRGKSCQLPVPFFSRRPCVRSNHSQWSELCAVFRRLGVPSFGSVADFEALPAVAVPSRFGSRCADQPLDFAEIATADAFEIVFRPSSMPGATRVSEFLSLQDIPTLPFEIDDVTRLRSLVALIKDLSGGDIPVGISLPLGSPTGDLRLAIESEVDFVTLESNSSAAVAGDIFMDLTTGSLVASRACCRSLGKPTFPLLVDHPVHSSEWLIKLLALGATSVSIDGLLAAVVQQNRSQHDNLSKGLLSGIADSYSKPSKSIAAALELGLHEAIERLQRQMKICDCTTLEQFDASRLISLDMRASQLTGVQLLKVGV